MRTNLIVKTSLFTLILAFFAIGTIAFAKEVMKKEKPVTEKRAVVMDIWYFQGGDPESPSSYSNNPADELPCLRPFQTICRIQAPANGNQPDFTEVIEGKTVQEHIEEAIANLPATEEPTGPVVLAYKSN